MPYIDLNNMEHREPLPGGKAHFVHSDNMTVSYWHFEPGTLLPEHAHPHEQITSQIEGEFELVIEGEAMHLKPGMVVVIPSNAIHKGKALSACYIIDVFHPVREDFK